MKSRKIVFLVVFFLLTLTFTFQTMALNEAYLVFEEGEVKAGNQLSLNLILEEAPKGVQRFDIQVKLDKKGVAVIHSATCQALPQAYCQIKKLSSESIQIKGLDIEDAIKAGAKDLVLASFTFEGVNPGQVGITITVNNFFNDDSKWVKPLITNGTLRVTGAKPKPPFAEVGGPYSCTAQATVKLDGSKSYDEDGSIQSWKWTVDGKSGSGKMVKFDCGTLAPGEYKVTLTITDNDGTSSSDNSTLTVKKKPPEEKEEKPKEEKPQEKEPEEKEEFSPLGSASASPKDLNDDGLYEDINGDGKLTSADVALFAYYINADTIQKYKDRFDFKEDGEVDLADCLSLASLIVSVKEKEVEWNVISVERRKLHEKKQVRLGLFISNLPQGFRRGDIEISLIDPEVAHLVGLENTAVDSRFLEVVKSSDKFFHFRIVDVLDQISGQVKNLKLADILLKGEASGQSRVGISITTITNDKGREVTDLLTRPGWLEIRIVIVGDSKAPPQDLDSDGLYEDINGDGKLDNHDLVLLGFYYDKPVVIENTDMFDFNGDGQISFEDLKSLYELLG